MRFSLTDLETKMRDVERGPPDPEGKSAAVSAVFRDSDAGIEVLLIRRAQRTGDPWSGHMAFPGGRRDPIDADLFSTALRETSEEVGLDLRTHAKLLGVLPDQQAISGRRHLDMPIRPFVFRLDQPVDLRINHEVSETFWTPVAPLIAGDHESAVELDYDNVRYRLPAWDLGAPRAPTPARPGEGTIVWGLTYRMLQDVIGRLRNP